MNTLTSSQSIMPTNGPRPPVARMKRAPSGFVGTVAAVGSDGRLSPHGFMSAPMVVSPLVQQYFTRSSLAYSEFLHGFEHYATDRRLGNFCPCGTILVRPQPQTTPWWATSRRH